MSALTVELAGECRTVLPGTAFTMGRVGDLVIDDDNPYLHRSFLAFTHADGFWWLANVGSRASVTLSDPRGLMRSTVGPGARIPLVFGRTVLTFSAGPYSYEVNVEIEAPVVEEVETPAAATSADTTIGSTSFTDGQMLVMIAVAEPLLKRIGTGVWAVPTGVQAARRLGWTQTKFNRKLDNVCDKLDKAGVAGLKGGPGRQAMGRRARLAEYAVSARLVTAQHLPTLDQEHERNAMPTGDER
ncbi:MAG: hypothetical protein IPL36_13760 [Nigerium sp.]|nr:hypothetical protein [Nigerium sp.]